MPALVVVAIVIVLIITVVTAIAEGLYQVITFVGHPVVLVSATTCLGTLVGLLVAKPRIEQATTQNHSSLIDSIMAVLAVALLLVVTFGALAIKPSVATAWNEELVRQQRLIGPLRVSSDGQNCCYFTNSEVNVEFDYTNLKRSDRVWINVTYPNRSGGMRSFRCGEIEGRSGSGSYRCGLNFNGSGMYTYVVWANGQQRQQRSFRIE